VSLDADKVADGIWIGSAPPVGDEVGDNFDALVLAADEYQPKPSEFPNIDKANILRVPMHDGTGELSLWDAIAARRAAKWVNAERSAGRRVLVTCYSGLHRSALIAGMAMRMGPERMSPAQVIKVLRQARGAEALGPPDFMDALHLAR
jgi:protein-tyrosine phosphatase